MTADDSHSFELLSTDFVAWALDCALALEHPNRLRLKAEVS